jgi:hypothetical protein
VNWEGYREAVEFYCINTQIYNYFRIDLAVVKIQHHPAERFLATVYIEALNPKY